MSRYTLTDQQFARLCDGQVLTVGNEVEIALEDIGFPLMRAIVERAAQRKGVDL